MFICKKGCSECREQKSCMSGSNAWKRCDCCCHIYPKTEKTTCCH